MAPIRPTDAAPSTPPAAEEVQSQKDFSPLQKGGYEDIPPVSGNKTGRSDSPSATDVAMGVGAAAIKGYLTGNYSQAVVDMLDQFGVIDSNVKPANYDNRMMEGAGGKTGSTIGNKVRGEGDTINGVQEKDTTSVVRDAVSRIAESIKNLDGAAVKRIATTMIDFEGKLTKSDVKDGPKAARETTTFADRERPEVEKRQRFNEAMAAMAEDFPDSFQASQELMQAAFKMAQTGKFDRDNLAQLAQDAAKEFANDPSGDAAKAFRALSEQLKADYGVSITIDRNGLEITNEAKGTAASMVLVNANGVMTGNIDIGPGGTGASVPPEVAVKNIMETRRENAFESGKLETPLGKIIDGIGQKIEPTKPFEPGGKEMPKPLPKPPKRYIFGNGNPLNVEAR